MSKVWEGNWQARVKERVRARGFSTLSAWSDARPSGTYNDLAAELGEDIAPFQVEYLLHEEAIKAGVGVLHRVLRAGLSRHLWRRLPSSGWDAKGTEAWSEAAGASAVWFSAIPKTLADVRDRADRVWDELAARAPRGWRPSGPDDPILVAAFEAAGLGEKR